MHRTNFFVDPKNVCGNELVLSEEETHHLSRVLRKKKGDIVWVVDGEGTGYEVEISRIETNGARCKILKTRRRIGEPVSEIHLAQSILKGERFDWLVEKVTEIGIRRIIPFTCENAVTVGGPQKIVRWRRIAMAAMKQSGRSILPEITSAMTFNQVVSLGSNCNYRFIAHVGPESVSVGTIESEHPITMQKAMLVVGPEGGFSKEEIGKAVEYGFQPVTLGPRRFRAETAGIVLSTLILSKLGELE